MIRPLLEEVRSYLRSGIAITNLTQCVEELVLNSLDAGASSVTVRIDVPNFKIQVSDNGSGIAFEDMKLVGERYSSSKCHDLEDLERLNFYGFRGEALASVREICDVLEIVSRHRSSYQTFCKLFRNSQVLEFSESRFPRTSPGTTITIHNILSNLPVRRKSIVEAIDFESARHRIASIALIHPKTAFLLINNSTGTKSLQTHVCKSSVSTFSQLFGNSRSKGLQPVHFEHKNFKLSGFISTDAHHSKSLQFLFVNSRLLLKTKIHKLVNSILGKSEHLRKLPPSEVDNARSEGDQSKMTSPQSLKPSDKHGVFVLNVDCPVTEYDICLEPAKTLIEFQDWDNVLYCVQRCVEEFLIKHNLMLQCEHSPKPATSGSSNEKGGLTKDSCHPSLDSFEYKKEIETSNVKKSLHSSTVFRRKKAETDDNRFKNKALWQEEHSISCSVSCPGKVKVSINNAANDDTAGNVALCHSVGSRLPGSPGFKSVSKGNSSHSLASRSDTCLTSVETPFSVCSFESESLDTKCREQVNTCICGSSIVTTSNSIEASDTCAFQINCTFNDLVPTQSSSNQSIISDSQVSFFQSRQNGASNRSRNSLMQKEFLNKDGFPQNRKVCDSAVSFDNEEDLQAKNLHLENSDSSKKSSLAKQGNTVASFTKVDKSRTKEMTTFTSPSPIMLQRVYARKRPQKNKETSVSSVEVVTKSRRLISLQVSHRRSTNRCSSSHDDGEKDVACCDQKEKKIAETSCDRESSTTSDSDVATTARIGNHPDNLSDNTHRNNDDVCSSHSIIIVGDAVSPVHARGATSSFPGNQECTSGETGSVDQMCLSHYIQKQNQLPVGNIVSCNPGVVSCDAVQECVLQKCGEKESALGNREICRVLSSQCSPLSESTLKPNSVAVGKWDTHGSNSFLNSDWFCTFDASLGGKLFVNARTGHSSFEPPPSRSDVVDDDCLKTSETKANGKGSDHFQNVPHPVASHLSFSCTPWLPRKERKQEASVSENEHSASEGASQLASLYQEYQGNQETEEKLCKWTDADKLRAYEKDLLNSAGKTVGEMLDSWENPVFAAPEKDILMVNKPGRCVGDLISVHNVVHPYRFTRDMLADMRVLRQIDDKFIVGIVPQEGDGDDLLVLVDQHAAHERVRLEQLQLELFEGVSSYNRPRMKSSPVSPPMEITLFAEEVRLLRTFQTEMERIGIRFVISDSARACDETLISVHGVPSVFVEREVSEVKRGRPSVAVSKVKELIREHLESILTTRGVPAVIPKVISQVISSQACHGAVKFGEPLGVRECQELIRRLSKCQLPFQCAHGRPSVIPLADLKFLGKKMMISQENDCPPRMNNLRPALVKQ